MTVFFSVSSDNEIVSSLPLQMSLYFNLWFFPFWWASSIAMLQLKYSVLPDYYKFILVTSIILTSLIEVIRLYLGYMGNLQEKVGVLHILKSHLSKFRKVPNHGLHAFLGQQMLFLYCVLHWLPVCFWVRIEDEVLTLKHLHGRGLGYLRDHLSPITSACPLDLTQTGCCKYHRILTYLLWVPGDMPSQESCLLCCGILIRPAVLWNILPPKIRLAPSLLIFCKKL
uniref:Transmembrane protein 17 n=1 Tax=Laticauda laticaudata TaxID=8630 RepID=A0A8C5S6D6_LATLA